MIFRAYEPAIRDHKKCASFLPMATAPQKKSPLPLLLIVVVLAVGCIPCTGILAAIAIPSFISYVKRSKVSEARTNLEVLYLGAASYYEAERVGPSGDLLTHCTVGPDVTPNVPSADKQVLPPLGQSFVELGFMPLDPVYYQYEIVAGPSRCGVAAGEAVYSFRAHGDLDSDGITSNIELSVGAGEDGRLFRAPGFFIEQELE